MSSDRRQIGYCTNVHAGADLPHTRANLERYALAVKRLVAPTASMGIGLWLSAAAAMGLRAPDRRREFADWLGQSGLIPFTLNGFPYGDFHDRVVKHAVYEPTWADDRRRDYTLDLIDIQHALLPPGMEGSISTLPIRWGVPMPPEETLHAAGRNLAAVAARLAQLEQETGRFISLCLEPEPGCVLQRKGDIIWFFQNYLEPHGKSETLRRYLRVCHDVCHSVVMFEDQADVLRTYYGAGIAVGKVQVSSAIRVDFSNLDPLDRVRAIDQLAAFAEDRYLHQTVTRERGKTTHFHQDLPQLLRSIVDPRRLTSEWRIHFHMPIYLAAFGHLQTSQDDVVACLDACRRYCDVRHFEVETYAWGVLPAELRRERLADGIADEMRWFADRMSASQAPT